MKSGVFLLVFGSLCAGCMAAAIIDTESAAWSYLNKYGYMKSDDMEDGMPMSDAIKQKAIEYFQLRANITMTGVVDDKTYEMMNLPRCGMVDMDSDTDMVRRKRYALGPRWSYTDLTYRIDGRTPDLPDSEVDRIMNAALKVWSDVSSLTFTEVSAGQDADIIINFYYGNHGDGANAAFDGPGGVLAHAYFPSSSAIGGDAHFDEDEDYTDGENSGINLFQVAAHEFGHSLGLEHSDVQGALMYPFYQGYVPNYMLHSDDIMGIQAQYGENVGVPEEPMATPVTPVGDCMVEISWTTRTSDGSAYLANATHVFKLVNDIVQPNYPRKITDEFPGLPENMDAALYYEPNGRTYFFKGSQYWRVSNQAVDAGYPRTISGAFRRLPNDIDSAFIWSGNGRIYFTKGDQYYRFTPGYGVDQGYPRPLSVWTGLPNTVDAAFQYDNARTYFFSGPDYYRYNDGAFEVDAGYPLSTAVVWLGCNPAELGLDGNGGSDNDAAAVMPSLIAVLFSAICALLYSQ